MEAPPDDKASGPWPCRTWTGGVHVRVAWACQCPCDFLMHGLRSKRSSNTLKRSIAWERTSRASGPSTLLPFSLLLGGPSVDTKLGAAPAVSALSYQQAKLPAGFTTWMSPSISQGAGTVTPVPALTLFSDGASQPRLPSRFTAEEWRVLTEIQLSQEEARDLELNSMQQRLSERWRHARANRLTASTFGQVVRRQAWTEKGLRNLIEPKDLTHTLCALGWVQHQTDLCTTLKNFHMVCWRSSAPHSLKDSEPEEAKKRKFSLVFGENGEPQLDRDHEYYAQVLGQMALTGCLWGDFVVCSETWIGIERIWFDRNEWEDMRKKLDAFFFEHMLPHLARR
ncbi:hypothetical protein MTO96_026625 [Rhipicephalus appendiculatus]